ncbi:MAG: hypothetical protein ACI4IK_05785 [Eubacterium sp.]
MSIKKSIIIISLAAVIFCLCFGACKSNGSNDNDYISDNTTVNATTQLSPAEENTNDGSGFEENDSVDEIGKAAGASSSRASSAESKNLSESAKSQSKTHTSKANQSTSNSSKPNKSTTKKATTEITTDALPPKAYEQNGEWGTPIKN